MGTATPAEQIKIKRGKGRPVGTTKAAKKEAIADKHRDKRVVNVTDVFQRTKAVTTKVICERGGARSSKSYSIAQLLIERFLTIPGRKILIVRKTLPSLRISTLPLVKELFESYNLLDRVLEEKQNLNFRFGRSLMHFGSVDDPEKIKCLHPDTEILTNKGFRSCTEVKAGDYVASVNPLDFTANYYPIKEMHVGNFDGEMVSPATETGNGDPYVNFCVTPGHDMVTYNKRMKSWCRKKAGTFPLNNANYAIPISCTWKGGAKPKYFEIPKVDWNVKEGGKQNKNGKKTTVFPIVPFLKFLGWYLSEGCTYDKYSITICQKSEKGKDQIRKDLASFPIEAKELVQGFSLYSKDLVSYLQQFGDCYNKYIPREIIDLHPSLLQHLFDALVAGDGRVESDKRWTYSSSSKQLADDVCEIAIKLGYATSIREVDTSTYYKGGKPNWNVSIKKQDRATIVKTVRTKYKGKVYCPTVPPNHTIIIRYKGKVSITGQSSEWNEIWMEEATEFDYQDFVNLKLRLSAPDNGVRNQLIMSFNPIDEYHWIKDKVIENRSEDVTEIVSNYLNNPFLSTDYIDMIKQLSLQDENFYKIYTLGEWGTLQNVIYSNWKIHNNELGNGEEIYGLDFGYNNPTTLIRCKVDSFEASLKEMIYQSGLTNSDLIIKLRLLIPEDKRQIVPIYADVAEPQRIQEIKDAGFYVKESDKSVKDGIDMVKRFSLLVTADSPNIIKEFRGYSYKTDRNGRVIDEPIKFNDHTMDAIRYALYSHALMIQAGKPRIRSLTAELKAGNSIYDNLRSIEDDILTGI